MHETSHPKPEKFHTGILLIAIFKLIKAALLIAVGIGAFSLLGRDVDDDALNLVNALRVDPDNKYIHGLLEKLTAIDDHRLRQIGAGTFIYAALLGTEGIGLALRKRWAEYLTIFVTASFVPIEIYEIVHSYGPIKVGVLVLNLTMVVYLVLRLRWELARQRRVAQQEAPHTPLLNPEG